MSANMTTQDNEQSFLSMCQWIPLWFCFFFLISHSLLGSKNISRLTLLCKGLGEAAGTPPGLFVTVRKVSDVLTLFERLTQSK